MLGKRRNQAAPIRWARCQEWKTEEENYVTLQFMYCMFILTQLHTYVCMCVYTPKSNKLRI